MLMSLEEMKNRHKQIDSEPEFYMKKMEKMFAGSEVSFTLEKTRAYCDDLGNLSRKAKLYAREMDDIASKLKDKDDQADRREAQELEKKFLRLSDWFRRGESVHKH